MIKENVIEKEMYKLRIKIDALNNKVNTWDKLTYKNLNYIIKIINTCKTAIFF
jgi:hypothetical protein